MRAFRALLPAAGPRHTSLCRASMQSPRVLAVGVAAGRRGADVCSRAPGRSFSATCAGQRSARGAPCPYTALGVPRTSSQKDIKAAFFALALKLHPDRKHVSEHSAAETAAFDKIVKAYETLKDPASRRAHDRAADSFSQAPAPHFHHMAYPFPSQSQYQSADYGPPHPGPVYMTNGRMALLVVMFCCVGSALASLHIRQIRGSYIVSQYAQTARLHQDFEQQSRRVKEQGLDKSIEILEAKILGRQARLREVFDRGGKDRPEPEGPSLERPS